MSDSYATYPFLERGSEHDRLLAQGALLDPLTRQLLGAAGLAPGMRVLDLGTGAGNLARIAADLVGPTGHVVGIDTDPAAVDLARTVTEAVGVPATVDFRVGDVRTLGDLHGLFDAVIGRLVLMYVEDPAAVLRGAAERVRPGGVVCVQECDFDYLWVGGPESALWEQTHRRVIETLEKVGAHRRLGPALFHTFHTAGLPDARLRVEAIAGGGSQAPAWGWANVAVGLLPLMERFGLTSHDDLDPDTLADRLLADTMAAGSCVIGPVMTGAWACRP